MWSLKHIAGWAIVISLASRVVADDPSSDPYSCSATSPCKIGCCSNTGVCGLGPDFCGSDVCISSCDAKSDCDPGWGSEWSTAETCPLNVCCSKFGFCGTTSEFCGNTTVTQPSCSSGTSASNRIIGYYEGWSSTRACRGMYPEDLLTTAYTHLNYAFAFVDPTSFEIAPMSNEDTALYSRFTALKTYNPGLETWISVGGWSMNDLDQPTVTTFSDLAGSESAQAAFFKSLVSFMSTYGFDGVDIDWEYPVAPERGGQAADFANYVSFLKNLKNALGSDGHNYGLTITLPSSYWYMQNFDIKSLESYVDWFNLMTYDLHGTWDSTDPYIGSVINAHTNLTEITQTLDLMWRNSIDPSKVVMGMGFYGRSFTLSDPTCTTAGCPFSGGGNPGSCSASAGTLMYSEIQDIIANGATVVEDPDAAVAIVTWDENQWVSYDNNDTLKLKMDYASSKCLGGVMIWAASTDDTSGSAIKALTGVSARATLTEAALFKWPGATAAQCVWEWSGSAPYCTTAGFLLSPAVFFTSATCPSSNPIKQTTSKYGSGGEQPCLYDGGWKSYCCEDPDPWANSNCAWHQGTDYSFTGWEQSWIAGGLLQSVTAPIFGRDCQGECPSGQVPIATDGTSCQPGTYSYYCCDNPNAPNLPTPQEVSLCPSPPNIDGRSTEPDPDGSSTGVYLESQEFNSDCTLYGLTTVSSTKRDLDSVTIDDIKIWEQKLEAQRLNNARSVIYNPNPAWEASFDSHDAEISNHTLVSREAHLLAKRTFDKSAALAFCAPGQPTTYMYPQTYSGYKTIARLANKGWITIAKPAICGALGVTSFLTQPANTPFVTEHVFEKQTLRNAIQYMAKGTLPGGGALTAKAATVTGIFDATGIFFDDWPSTLTPSWGTSPVITAFGALGHAQAPANYDNLQVCDADLNAIKAKITAAHAFIASTAFGNLGPLEQVAFLADVIDTFNYIMYVQTAGSYNAAYRALISFWTLFSTHPLAQAGYDYVGAFKEIINADIDHQVATALALFKTYTNEAITTWNDPTTIASYGAVVALANQAALADFLANAAVYIAMDKATMLA
ncbi:glycoside hydrolase family 18 protein [Penicillium malachiteum]|uniref:glycoside hydrolase family 18 protein n=1 Tax=Penicillium malachiteum TaxID=1324776 RepID=UPI002546B597|nr:glycoside hydrolase family 18 protein [Penicillium malachiteum]KAJ5735165.1 glycoside hydrolase family 18 protein [Penicillium malachiteum]